MWTFLVPDARAEEIPTYVLLQRDVALCPGPKDRNCRTPEAPASPSAPWRDPRVWRVVEERGAWLSVESTRAVDIPGGPCLEVAPVDLALSLRVWVRRSAAVPATARALLLGDPAGSIALAAGLATHPVGERQEVSGLDFRATLQLPDDATSILWAAERITHPPVPGVQLTTDFPFSLPSLGEGVVFATEVFGSFVEGATRTLAPHSPGCVVLVVPEDGRADHFKPDRSGGLEGGIIGGRFGGREPKLQAGALLSWPNGESAGVVNGRSQMTVPSAPVQDGRLCFDAWEGPGSLTVCVTVE